MHLEADQEADLGQRLEGAGGVGHVVRVDPADDQRRQHAVGGRGEDLVGVAARGVRERTLGEAPGLLDLGARGGIGDAAATGQQRRNGARLQRTPVARATRHPADLRTGAGGQRGDGRVEAGDLRSPVADQDHRTRRRREPTG